MLDACRTRWLDEPAAWALLEQDRIVAVNAGARELGLHTGLRRSGANALAPGVCLIDRDPAAERRLLDEAALATLAYTPASAQYEDHTLLLEVEASLKLFGGPRRLLRHIQEAVRSCGVQARAALAPTAQGAWLLARQAPRTPSRHALKLGSLARRLDALPCALLPQSHPLSAWLEGIACHTLGDLRRLPRAGLLRRSSPELLQSLDAAYTPALPKLTWFVPPAQYSAEADLVERLEHLIAVQAVTDRLLTGLYRWLAASRLAVRSLRIELHHERGRHARPPTTLSLSLAEPAWQPDHLQGPLQEHFSRLAWAGPVVRVRLDTLELAEQPAINTQLFPEPGGAPEDYRRLLDLLTARLGTDGVLYPDACPDHRPEFANRWRDSPAKGAAPVCAPGERPFWLLATPQALVVEKERPVHGTPLTLLRGPERIESGWWNGPYAKRDYFTAQDDAGARYWIFCERGKEMRWFLHGLFG